MLKFSNTFINSLYAGLISLTLMSLSGCFGGLWTGANLVYDRHSAYKKWDDYHLYLKVNDALAVGKPFQRSSCVIDLAVFNGDILLAGHVPSLELQEELKQRLSTITGYRRLFNQITVQVTESNTAGDSWITTKIRSQIFADDSIDPNAFKVITSDGIVYLMGDVRQDQAEKVINLAKRTAGVVRVVKIFNYLVLHKAV